MSDDTTIRVEWVSDTEFIVGTIYGEEHHWYRTTIPDALAGNPDACEAAVRMATERLMWDVDMAKLCDEIPVSLDARCDRPKGHPGSHYTRDGWNWG